MPENPQPSWGPASYDDRDLDAVLNGVTTGLPDALRPVVATLDVLRSAPIADELAGEAAARAAFRAMMAAGVGGPGPAADESRTLVLPISTGNGGSRSGKHRRRRAPARRPWRSVALLGSAAAAVVVVGAAGLTGVFSGSAGHSGATTQTSVASSGTGSSAPSTGLGQAEGTGTAVPSPSPTPKADPDTGAGSGATGDRAMRCRQDFAFYTQLDRSPGRARRIPKYCDSYLGQLWANAQDNSGGDGQNGGQGDQGGNGQSGQGNNSQGNSSQDNSSQGNNGQGDNPGGNGSPPGGGH